MVKNNKKILIILFSVVIGMFGFGFLLVPIYNTMCSAWGINGKTATTASAESKIIDKNRLITVEFVSTNNAQLPWKFYPNTKVLQVHPGESKRIAFHAENDSDHAMTVQAIPSVTPGLAAQYLKKTECFCFTQQRLISHGQMDMPLIFHLDPNLPKNIHTITLSYTLFDVTDRQNKATKPAGKIS